MTCKWMTKNGICVNYACPMCAADCPVPDNEGVCRYEDRPMVNADGSGRWMHTVGQGASYRYCCSICGKIAYFVSGNNSKVGYQRECTYKFCPNCGAKMDGGTE